MKETNLNLRAGQTGKITFTEVTGYTQEPSLRGGVKVNGTCVNMQLQPDGRTLVIPPLPEGVWIYEVRADGATALWGRLRVMESPLASASGCVCWQGSLDKDSQEVLYATLAISSGQQGEQGPKGDKGDPGPAPTAEQMQAAASGMIYETSVTQHRSIEGSGNASLHWLQLDARRVPAGKLQAISIPCRDTAGVEAPGPQALYLTLWELSVNGVNWMMLGSSTEAVQQVVNETSRWEFEGIKLSGRKFRICAAAEPNVWDESQWLGVRTASREDGEDSRIVGHSHVNVVTDVTFEMVSVAPRFAPAEHVGDATHLQPIASDTTWRINDSNGDARILITNDSYNKLNLSCPGPMTDTVSYIHMQYGAAGDGKGIKMGTRDGSSITMQVAYQSVALTNQGLDLAGTNVIVPNGSEMNHAVNLGQMNEALDSHRLDSFSHLSETEHAGLTVLLAHKDELLALLETSAANETST